MNYKEAYEKHKHLKNAADELGIPWQTLYVHLKKEGVPVCGDKSTYGSLKDKLAAHGEEIFKKIIPTAIDNNQSKFQAKVDFHVGSYAVDVKTATPRKPYPKYHSFSWSFSLRKQSMEADFFVFVALDSEKNESMFFLIPAEMVRGKQTISIPLSLKSKWKNFMIEKRDLKLFFNQLPALAA